MPNFIKSLFVIADAQQSFFRHKNLIHFFDAVVTGHDIKHAKPDPEIFLLGSERIGIPPKNCLVFEDAPSGIEAGLAANMKCIGVGSADVLPGVEERITDYASIDINSLLNNGTVN